MKNRASFLCRQCAAERQNCAPAYRFGANYGFQLPLPAIYCFASIVRKCGLHQLADPPSQVGGKLWGADRRGEAERHSSGGRMMDQPAGVVERAFQLAQELATVEAIRVQLRKEGYSSVDAHLMGRKIRSDL